ncbi:hypothetical protein KPH14_006812 [Odynerus spinipes]|uniref:Uncharacterized protein n=1 Tax=Odynerus spinipes TaxID=1348599 RepID=A0AAD9VSH2_9HYME|nr:hypothetical protein KPH14_006812 [Odynerus spinipes]
MQATNPIHFCMPLQHRNRCPMGHTFNGTLRGSLPSTAGRIGIGSPQLSLLSHVYPLYQGCNARSRLPPPCSLVDKDSRWGIETETHA